MVHATKKINWQFFSPNAQRSSHCSKKHAHMHPECTNLATGFVYMSAAASRNLQIDLQQNSLGVGKIFLHRQIRDEKAVRHSLHRFCSVPIFSHEKCRFVPHNARFLPLRGMHKCTHFLSFWENPALDSHETWFLRVFDDAQQPQKVWVKTIDAIFN